MKIAFDVQGTLQGPYQPRILALFRAFAELECELTVWSFGGHQMASEAIQDLKLQIHAPRVRAAAKNSKEYGWKDDPDYRSRFDLCIDDDRSTAPGLDATMVLYVSDVPASESEVAAFAKGLVLAFEGDKK